MWRVRVFLPIIAVLCLSLPVSAQNTDGDGTIQERVTYQIAKPDGTILTSQLDITYSLNLNNMISDFMVALPNVKQRYEKQDNTYQILVSVPKVKGTYTVQVSPNENNTAFITKVYYQDSTIPVETIIQPKAKWYWRTVKYSSPRLGSEPPLDLGFLIFKEKVVDFTAKNETGIISGRTSEGNIAFRRVWRRVHDSYNFITVIQNDNNHWKISTYLDGTEEVKIVEGVFPITKREIVAEVIYLSKTDEATIENANPKHGVITDLQLADAIIFAADSYSISLPLYLALVYQESKFNARPPRYGDIQGPAQVSRKWAIQELEDKYFYVEEDEEGNKTFNSRDFETRFRNNNNIRPRLTHWNSYKDNLLYGAAYLRFLELNYMARVPEPEVWKFMLVYYNFGPGDAGKAWKKASYTTTWNKTYADNLTEGEKRSYAGSVYFYKSILEQGERNLRQFDAGSSRSSERRTFITNFNK